MDLNTILALYGDWIVKIAILIGVIVNLWLHSNYVGIKRYEADSAKNLQDHLTIQSTLNELSVAIKLLAATQTRLDDHEQRLRILEQSKADVIARLTIVERTALRGNS